MVSRWARRHAVRLWRGRWGWTHAANDFRVTGQPNWAHSRGLGLFYLQTWQPVGRLGNFCATLWCARNVRCALTTASWFGLQPLRILICLIIHTPFFVVLLLWSLTNEPNYAAITKPFFLWVWVRFKDRFLVPCRFRIVCHYICNHSYFGNIVLVCIMVSSAMLAAEDPLNSNSERNKASPRSTLSSFNPFKKKRWLCAGPVMSDGAVSVRPLRLERGLSLVPSWSPT